MSRYNIDVYTKPGDFKGLQNFTENLNWLNWKYTRHSIDNIKYRAIDLEGLLLFIRGLKLETKYIFEYYINDLTNEPEKVCYRIPYLKAGNDLILVMDRNKSIVTIWLNSCDDKHSTLKRELYING
jgi:hypothetical protein